MNSLSNIFKIILKVSFILCFIFLFSANVNAAKKEYSTADINFGRELYRQKCATCHGNHGEGGVASAIGCNGVANKNDNFLFETVYYGRRGRKGNHGLVMPSWGKKIDGNEFGEASLFKKVLVQSNKFTKQRIEELVNLVYGSEVNLISYKKRGADVVNKLGGPMTNRQINQVIVFLRNLENLQSENTPSECIDRSKRVRGNLTKGKKIYEQKCLRCHAEKGDVDDFFLGKDVAPRNFNDKLYMNSKSDEYLKDLINSGGLSKGRSGIMAPMALDDDSLNDVIIFIRTFSE